MNGRADGTGTPAGGATCVTTRRVGGASRPNISGLVHIDPPRTWACGHRRPDPGGRRRPGRARDRLLLPADHQRDFTGHGIGKILVPLMVRREARKEMPGNMASKQKIEAG